VHGCAAIPASEQPLAGELTDGAVTASDSKANTPPASFGLCWREDGPPRCCFLIDLSYISWDSARLVWPRTHETGPLRFSVDS
jgi:hypothetical protein